MVGGAPTPVSADPSASSGGFDGTALNVTTLIQLRDTIDQMREFTERVYLPDVIAIGSYYKDWFERGEGVGNFLTYGDFPMDSSGDKESWFIPPTAVMNRDFSTATSVDLSDPEQVTENVARAWYTYEEGDEKGLHPWDGETTLNYDGPKPPYKYLNTEQSYSWIKSPRWRGEPMELGPLARLVVWLGRGNKQVTELTKASLKKLDLPMEAIYSTMGRTLARSMEAVILSEKMDGWLDDLIANIASGDLSVQNTEKWDPSTWPKLAKGVGVVEAGRGALGHWMVIRDGKIANYQAVVPTTWLAGPRDGDGKMSPYEAALRNNHSLADKNMPLEIIRTVHSFDPCLACAVHVTEKDKKPGIGITIR